MVYSIGKAEEIKLRLESLTSSRMIAHIRAKITAAWPQKYWTSTACAQMFSLRIEVPQATEPLTSNGLLFRLWLPACIRSYLSFVLFVLLWKTISVILYNSCASFNNWNRSSICLSTVLDLSCHDHRQGLLHWMGMTAVSAWPLWRTRSVDELFAPSLGKHLLQRCCQIS